MSHALVTVIGPNIAELLAPYDENTRVAPYRNYVTPLPPDWRHTMANRAEFQRLVGEGLVRQAAWARVWGERNDDPSVAFEFTVAIEAGVDPTDLGAVLAANLAKYPDAELRLDNQGLYEVSTYNPKSKWDWWSLGGRWAGRLLLKPGVEPLPNAYGEDGVMESNWASNDGRHVSAALKATIDWERMAYEDLERDRKRYAALIDPNDDSARRWETKEAAKALALGEEAWLRQRERRFYTAAFLGTDGEWIENGRLIWFGMTADEDAERDWPEEFNRLLDKVGDNEIVSVIDYHI